MKKKHLTILLPLILISMFLSACGSAVAAASWPGVNFDEGRGLIYLAYNQHVVALRVDDGVQVWKYPAEPQSTFLVFSAPQLTADGQVVIGTYGNELFKLNPDNSGIPAPGWPFKGASNRYIGSALVLDEAILAPNSDGRLYAVDLDGQLAWPGKGGIFGGSQGPLWTQPVTDGEVVFVPSLDHKLYALDAASGEEAQGWAGGLDLGSAIIGQPALSGDGLLYASTLDSVLVTVDTQRGEVVSSFATQGPLWSGPALIEGMLYVGDLDGMLYAFDVNGNGGAEWTLDLGSAVTGPPVLFNELLYVVTEGGQLYSISLDGRQSEVPLLEAYQGAKYGSPLVAGDYLLVSLVNSEVVLFALDATGRVAWQYSLAQ
ncbi:MAG: PQQ-binding-like beta-propeller repeat protein [Anaerolineales bacterium]